MARSQTLTGTLEHVDLGAGSWVLVTDDGTRWQLAGAIPERLAGRQVEVRGKPAALFGFGAGGKTLEVESVRRA